MVLPAKTYPLQVNKQAWRVNARVCSFMLYELLTR
nr:MAG TPA: hypothetical protein [Caudoviricetes sp.]